MEWGGLLRRMRTQETGDDAAANPPAATPTEESAEPLTPQGDETAAPQAERHTWASGAFLAAAARLVARGDESTYTLRRIVEWATAATGARRAVLWAVENDAENNPQLTLLAWAAVDGWRPSDLPALQVRSSPTLMRAFRTSEAVTVTADRPLERGADWDARLGLDPIALCAAISAGETRGILAVAGLNRDAGAGATFGDDARTALVACAALAAIVFERLYDEKDRPQDAPCSSPDTSLPDSAAMTQRLDQEIGRTRRFEHPLAVLLLTIDRGEEWAERLSAADFAAVRAHLIAIVRESIREVDLLGNGEDGALIIILPVSNVDDALRVGERIRAALDTRQPDLAAVARLRLTISGGAVSYPDDGASGAELLAAAAQTAAYARRMGRDQIRLRGLGDMDALSPTRLGDAAPPEGAALSGTQQIDQVFHALLDSLTMAGDAHDQARPGHGQAVGRYARALAEACGLNPDQAQTIALAGTLHDVGKIGLPAEILSKRGALTQEERAILRAQPMIGKLMLAQIPALEAIIPLVEHAHERYDGNGYPAGLRGNQIPFGSRLIAIAEGYEAMINERPYRRALSQSMAIAEMSREAGSRYDPQLVDTFVRLLGVMRDAAGGPTPLGPITIATSAPGPRQEGPIVEPALADPPARAAALTSVPNAPPVRESQQTADPVATKELTAAHMPTPEESAVTAPIAGAPLSAAAAPEAQEAGLPIPTPTGHASPQATVARQEAHAASPAPTPAPTTGEPSDTAAPDAHPQGAAHEQPTGEASIEWYDDDVAYPDNATAERKEDERPDQLNVEDTILVMSQTTLLRMAELSRLNKRRTGYLSLDPKRDDKE